MITNNKTYTNYSLRCIYVEPDKVIHNNKSYKQNNNTKKQKESINNWIEHYKFTHFFTLRFQKHHEREDLALSTKQLEKYMTLFEKKLTGRRWKNKHLFFIAFAERGTGLYWHFHILFRLDGLDEERLIKALENVEVKMKLSQYNICIDSIDYFPQTVIKYSTKEIRFNQSNIGDTSTIIPSTSLFDLPYEKTYHYLPEEKQNTTNKTDQLERTNIIEKAVPDKSFISAVQAVYHKAKSLLRVPLSYVDSFFNQCLLYYAYTLPVDQSYLFYTHRQLYDDLADSDDGYD